VIAAIVINSNQAPKNFIYHVSSSLRNPLKISDVHNISHQYFMKTPCLNKDGKPIIISKELLWKVWLLLTFIQRPDMSYHLRFV